MLKSHNYYVYILTNRKNEPIYIGVTNNLYRRLFEHQHTTFNSFAKKYHLNKLVYFEHTHDVNTAIQREKQLKGWRRAKKIALIQKLNPNWDDLYKQFEISGK